MQTFKDLLESDRAYIFDGAMGTMLYSKGIYINRSYDELNLVAADLVREVHSEYVRAGADIIETNTFVANRIKLGSFGIACLRLANRQGGFWHNDILVIVVSHIGPFSKQDPRPFLAGERGRMTTRPSRINSKRGPVAKYHVQKKNGSFWVMTPDGKAIVVPHKTRHEAQMIANVFNHTKRDPLTVVTERQNRFTPRQTDTLIAALRLWQRAPQYPEIEIAEEHGKMLSDKEIDSLIETQLNS